MIYSSNIFRAKSNIFANILFSLLRYFTTLLVLFVTFICSFSQDKNEHDGLAKAIQHRVLRDTTLVLQLCEFAYSFNDRNDSIIKYANQALQLSQDLNFDKGIGRAYWLLGMANYYIGHIDSSEYFLEAALPYSEDSKDIRELGRIYNTMANVARFKGNSALALDLYFKSLLMKEKNGDLFGKALTLNNIGNIYSDMKEHEKALSYLNNSLVVRRQIGKENSGIMLFADLANGYLNLNKLDSSKYFINRGLQNSNLNEDYWPITNIYEVGVRYFKKVGKSDSAFFFITEGLKNAELAKSEDKVTLFQLQLADYYLQKGQFKQAINEVDKVLTYAKKMRRLEYEANAIRIKSSALSGLGFFEEAFKLSLLYKILDDSLKKQSFSESLLAKELGYQLDRQKINSEKRELESSKKLQQTRWVTFSFLLTTIGIGVLAYFYYQNSNLRKVNQEKLVSKQREIENKRDEIALRNQDLVQQKDQILILNHSLEATVELRTKELHQSVRTLTQQNQNLEQFSFIVSHNLRSPLARIKGILNLLKLKNHTPLELESMHQLLFDSSTQLDAVIRDLTDILNIRKGVDYHSERIIVYDVLRTLFNSFEDELKKVNAIIDINISPQLEIVGVKAYVNSIFYNLISNALKYKAKNRPLSIALSSEVRNGFCYFKVKDNGLGIDLANGNDQKIFGLYKRFHPSVEGKGFGLYLVKTQLETMNGTIQVKSQLNIGTEFTFSIPV